MSLALAYMPAFLLTLVRVTAMISAMLFLGTTGESRWPRVILAFGLSVLLFARQPEVLQIDEGLLGLGFIAAREAVLGIIFGFAIQLIFVTLRMTGSLLGHEMGFTMAQVVDPTTGASSPVVSRFFETLSFLFLLAIDAHHEAFRILADSFDRVPVGQPWKLQALIEALWKLSGEGIELAVSLATPVYGSLILLTVVLIVLARAVPQIHLMEFGYAVRILVALGITWVYFGIAAPYIYRLFERILGGTRQMLELSV